MLEKDKTEKDYWQNVRPEGAEKITLGDYYSHVLRHDTRFLLFSLARYKFAAKMIGQDPKRSVLELGCNEGLGTLLLSEHASQVMAVDFDSASIQWASANLSNDRVQFLEDNFLGKQYGNFDAVISLDVIEHILPDNQDLFLQTILMNLGEDGFCIVGTPNATASPYAAKESAEGHVCLYAAEDLKAFFLKGFKNVFIFGMNDEVVHTGFPAMCHYLFVLACKKITGAYGTHEKQ